MNILSLLGSKASMAIIGVLMVGGTWGALKLKVWRLDSLLAKEQTFSAKVEAREQVCKTDLEELRLSFFKQNERIDQMHEEAAALTIAADKAANQKLVSVVEIEQIIQTSPGHQEMNRFVANLFKEDD